MKSIRNQRIKGPDIGYITLTGSGVVSSCNELAAGFIGSTMAQLLHQPLLSAIEDDHRFIPLVTRLRKPLSAIVNEQFYLPDYYRGEKEDLMARLVKLPGEDDTIHGLYIGLIDRSAAVTVREMALNSIAEGVFTVNHEMKITSFNAAAEKMTGWRQDEVLGRPCKAVFKSNICGQLCAVSSAIQKNTTMHYDRDVYIHRKDGSAFPIALSSSPLVDSKNRIIGG
ncbi:MAG TPA: hypothetical protein DDX81_00165, partial [Desulfofustis sp.]|nr:hypothetical protein [Desulfofustis sp.]